MGGILASLLGKAVGGVKTVISKVRLANQVIAAGATVTTTQSGGGSSTQVNAPGTSGVPMWVWYLVGGLLVVPILLLLVKKLFK